MFCDSHLKAREIAVAGKRAKRRFLFDQRLTLKSRGLFALLQEHAPGEKLSMRALQRLAGGGVHATRTAVDELVSRGYVSVDAGDVEVLRHPVEGGIYEDPGLFSWMEVVAVGQQDHVTVFVARLHGELIILPVDVWETAAFNQPRLRDRVRYLTEYRGDGTLFGRYVRVVKSGDDIHVSQIQKEE